MQAAAFASALEGRRYESHADGDKRDRNGIGNTEVGIDSASPTGKRERAEFSAIGAYGKRQPTMPLDSTNSN